MSLLLASWMWLGCAPADSPRTFDVRRTTPDDDTDWVPPVPVCDVGGPLDEGAWLTESRTCSSDDGRQGGCWQLLLQETSLLGPGVTPSTCLAFTEFVEESGWLTSSLYQEIWAVYHCESSGHDVIVFDSRELDGARSTAWFDPDGDLATFSTELQVGSYCCDAHVNDTQWWGPVIEAPCGDQTTYLPEDFDSSDSGGSR